MGDRSLILVEKLLSLVITVFEEVAFLNCVYACAIQKHEVDLVVSFKGLLVEKLLSLPILVSCPVHSTS